MYKGVIFDLDGTVLDTIEDIKDALNEALDKMGYFHSYSNEETMLMVGSGFKVLIERAAPENTSDEDIEKALNYFIEAYDKCYAKKTKAFSGIREVLGTMMDKVGDYYHDEHENALAQIKVFIEPVLIIFLAVGVGGILLAVILPMFSMYNQLM